MTPQDIRYPNIEVNLRGRDGNAFVVIGQVTAALRQALPPEEFQSALEEFTREAMDAGSYPEFLQVVGRWVSVPYLNSAPAVADAEAWMEQAR